MVSPGAPERSLSWRVGEPSSSLPRQRCFLRRYARAYAILALSVVECNACCRDSIWRNSPELPDDEPSPPRDNDIDAPCDAGRDICAPCPGLASSVEPSKLDLRSLLALALELAALRRALSSTSVTVNESRMRCAHTSLCFASRPLLTLLPSTAAIRIPALTPRTRAWRWTAVTLAAESNSNAL